MIFNIEQGRRDPNGAPGLRLGTTTLNINYFYGEKWWGILDSNLGPRHSGLCRLHDSPDYLFTHLKGMGRFFGVIKGS